MREKILLVSSEFPPGPGGIGNHAFSLAKYLVGEGYEVHVIADTNYTNEVEIIAFDGVLPGGLIVNRVKRIWIFTYFIRVWLLFSLIARHHFKTAIFSGKFSLWLCGLQKFWGFKVASVCVLHGSEVQMRSAFNRKLTDWAISRSDFLVPVSAFTHSLLSSQLQKKPYKIIENGIDLKEFQALDQQRAESSLQLAGEPALLTVGHVNYRKGQHRVIRALPEIVKRFPRAHYHLVGLPSMGKEFMELANRLGVQNHVTIHGRLPHRKDVAQAYSQADCFMLLSENQEDGDVEGFGIVVLEANFFGLPAIGALGCGIADAIEPGYNGYLVDGDNATEITQKLEAILANKESFQQGSRSWAGQHSWEHIVKKYIGVIESIE